MKVYAAPADALEDAMRLSAAMTRKLAVAGLPFGGGKAVLAVPSIPSGERRRALLLRYAELVASLGGKYRTSSDINTNEADKRPRHRAACNSVTFVTWSGRLKRRMSTDPSEPGGYLK